MSIGMTSRGLETKEQPLVGNGGSAKPAVDAGFRVYG